MSTPLDRNHPGAITTMAHLPYITTSRNLDVYLALRDERRPELALSLMRHLGMASMHHLPMNPNPRSLVCSPLR
jgi:hypothetical protein